MPISNYGYFNDGVYINGRPVQQIGQGKVYYVSNNTTPQYLGAVGNNSRTGSSTLQPLATIPEAMTRCVAGRGDVIVVGQGHTETYSSATDLVLSKAGVTVVGLGSGSNRPTITLDTAITSTIAITAANVTVSNLIVTANFADITAAFTVSATNVTIDSCYVKATATNMNFLSVVKTGVTTSNAVDRLTVNECLWIEPDLATLNLVTLTGSEDRLTVTKNKVLIGVNNNVAALVDAATGKIVTNAIISENRVRRLNTDTATGGIIYKTDGTTSTGLIYDNYVRHADTAAAILVTAGNAFGLFNNMSASSGDVSGMLLPLADDNT